MIDLHLHTTASDGFCTPAELVRQAQRAGVTALAVTDHDTTAAVDAVRMRAEAAGLTVVPGIEITAMEAARDVHLLGYFIDPSHRALQVFLDRARASRLDRVRAIADRLAAAGAPVDVRALLDEAEREGGRSIGRPQVARAIVAAGHAADVGDAFDRWLTRGRPGFVPRAGATPEQVIAIVHDAGGLVSLAHPVLAGIDERIPALRDAGLDALEVYHPEHDPATRDRYLGMARALGMLVTGGSDYHGDPAHGPTIGTVTLPAPEWEQLSAWPRRSLR